MTRLQKYIKNKKKQGFKRVSFFVNIKLWNYIRKRVKKENMTINDYLSKVFEFK